MKKTFNFLAAIALVAMVVVGCEKSPYEVEEVVPGAGTTVLFASTGSEDASTRVNLEETGNTEEGTEVISVTWRNVSADDVDKITLYSEAGDRLGDFTYGGDNDATSGKFTGDVELEAGKNYVAVYPASTALTLTARAEEKLAFAEQTQARQVAIINDAVRMKADFTYTEGEVPTMTFVHEMSIVAIDIAGQPNNKPQTLTFSNGADSEYVIGYSADAVEANTAIRTYIAVHPVSSTTERTLSFELVYTNGLDWEFETTTTKAYAAGMLYTMPVEKSQTLYIATADELAAFAADVNAGHTYEGRTVVLTDDITLSGEWTPIGVFTHDNPGYLQDPSNIQFKGVFDGGNYTISGLTIANATNDGQGLFGLVVSATIKNVKISNPQISSTDNDYIGALVGHSAESSTIENCAVIGGSVSGNSYVSGIVGYATSSSIKSCYNTATVTGTYSIGGILGSTDSSVISCYNTGSVDGTSAIGGVVGFSDGSVVSSYNVGIVSGTNNVGSIVGSASFGGATTADCFYLTGTATAGHGNPDNVIITNLVEISTVQGLNDLVGATDGLLSGEGNFTKGNPTADHLPQLMGENLPWEDPVLELYISNEAELKAFRDEVNGGNTYEGWNVIVDDNITLTSEWTPIGTSNSILFKGNFDGGNHTISGLTITDATTAYQGLFGYVSGATIKNLKISNPQISSSAGYAAALLGYGQYSSLANCAVIGGSISGTTVIAGVVGQLSFSSSITQCSNTATVTTISSGQIGGITGYMEGLITQCYNGGNLNGSSLVGGIAGESANAEITSSYNTGDITGTSSIGGIIGRSAYGATTTSCYNTGSVNGTSTGVGGVIGSADSFNPTNITSCYNVGIVTGPENTTGSVIGTSDADTYVTDCYFLLGSHTVGIGRNQGFGTTKVVASVKGLNDLVGATNGLPSADFTKGNPTADHLPQLMGENLEWETPAFQIPDAATLKQFADMVNAGNTFEGVTVEVTDNINIEDLGTGYEWTPIGNASDKYFYGTFDGGNKIISGLKITNATADYQGLFGHISYAIIKNVKISEPQISSSADNVGALVGYIASSTIENCAVTGGSVSGNNNVGGISGNYTDAGSMMTNCYNTATISGASHVGGVSGYGTSMTSCYNTGTVTSTGDNAGGIAGQSYGEVNSCYNIGSVNGASNVSGIIGYSSGAHISSSYNTGSVTGTSNIGGIIGYMSADGGYSIITSSYNVGKLSGTSAVGGIIGNAADAYYDTSSITNSFYLAGSATLGVGVNEGTTTVTNVVEVATVQGLNDLVGATNGLPSADFTVGSPEATRLPQLMGENIEWIVVVPDPEGELPDVGNGGTGF